MRGTLDAKAEIVVRVGEAWAAGSTSNEGADVRVHDLRDRALVFVARHDRPRSELVVVSLWTMGAGLWARGPDGERDPPYVFIARAAVLAAFVALLVHTMAYAGFFQDPITWVLMAIGASLAAARIGAPDRRISASSVARVQSTPRSLRP